MDELAKKQIQELNTRVNAPAELLRAPVAIDRSWLTNKTDIFQLKEDKMPLSSAFFLKKKEKGKKLAISSLSFYPI